MALTSSCSRKTQQKQKKPLKLSHLNLFVIAYISKCVGKLFHPKNNLSIISNATWDLLDPTTVSLNSPADDVVHMKQTETGAFSSD